MQPESKKRVLLAEDEPNIVESLTFLVERAGFAVDVATTGPEALAAVEAAPPDVLVLDVMLPGIDGLEVLRRLRGAQATATLPVLMLTAKGQREDRENALSAGADQFMTKPFSNAALLDAVRQLAQGRASPVR